MISNSLAIIAIVLGIILLIPSLCQRVHIPGIVGFIVVGILIGPHGLNLIPQSETIRILGQMGMLYIMLQAGIEVDINDFSQYKRSALIFGLYSFTIPFLLGMFTSWLLGFGLSTCSLLGAMYGSHTLMTYPIVSRYGVQKTPAVNIVVGGTMVAITLSLLVLAVIKSHLSGNESALFWWALAGKIVLFGATTLWLFPWLAQKIFKRQQDSVFCFLLVMTMLTLSAFLADWAGLEGILGAFVCGVALNRLVPNRSPLMDRINFVGNSIFVPLFLLDVGMMIDISLCWRGWTTLLIAGVMIATKLVGKWLAAWAAKLSFSLTTTEGTLIFGLTHATAAGTLAIVTIGYQIGLFNTEILNGAVLMILVLCTLSSFVTEYAAKRIALQEEAKLESERTQDEWIMLSIGEDIHQSLKELSHLSSLHETEMVQAGDWQEAYQLIEHSGKSAAIYHEQQPLNTISRLLVAVPRYAEKEYDFISCFGQIRRLSSQIGAKVVFFASEDTQRVLKALCQRKGKYLRASYREMGDWEEVLMLAKEAQKDDMIVMVSSRHATASYNPLFEQIPGMLERFFAPYSYLILYPEQHTGGEVRDVFLTDTPQPNRTWHLLARLRSRLARLIRRRQIVR